MSNNFKHSEYCPCEGKPVPDKAYTVNRVEIVAGLRVFTNNLDKGTVDLSRAEWKWHHGEQVHHLWFDVDVDTNYRGESVTQQCAQSDDRVTTRFEGVIGMIEMSSAICGCEHIQCWHPRGSVAAGQRSALYVGPVCDDCADSHMKPYLIGAQHD